jgi:hypothetical protein
MSTEALSSCSRRRTNLAQNFRGLKIRRGGPQQEILASDRKIYPKNALLDFCASTIHRFAIQNLNGVLRIGHPSRQYTGDYDTASYTSRVECATRKIGSRLNAVAPRAIDHTLGSTE